MFITHDLGVVANVAERVAVLYAGQIVELGSVEEGEDITCTGYYTDHRVYGEQFRCVTCERTLPTKHANMIKYLAGSFEEIKLRTAKNIVNRYGDDTFDMIENDFEKLTEFGGLSIKQRSLLHSSQVLRSLR